MIIKAVFTGRFCTTRRVFQWDSDDYLQFVNLDLPQNYTVDFANSLTGDSVPVLATSDTVQIPPDLFVPGSEIYAWVWISSTNGGHTRCQTTIPIDPRAQRSGTSPAPAQASAWDQAVQTLNDAAADYETAISHAPIIQDDYWYIWDSTAGEYVNTDVKAAGIDGTDGEDGEDGNNAWTVDAENTRISGNYVQIPVAYLVGPSGASAKAGDVVFISDGRFTQISRIVGQRADTTLIGDLHGADGAPGQDGAQGPQGEQGPQGPAGPSGGQFWTATSAYTSPDYTWATSSLTGPTDGTPAVGDLVYYSAYRYTITSIDTTAGTVNCTIRASIRGQQGPAGQGVPAGGTTGQVLKKKSGTDYDTEWANESGGGGGTSDYTDLTNKPQINGHTLSGNQSAADLGLGTYSKPSGGIPKTDLESAVQTSLGKADTALQPGDVAEPYFVTYSTSDMTTWTCDKTFAQIIAAFTAGKQIIIIASVSDVPVIQECSLVYDTSSNLITAWIAQGIDTGYFLSHDSTDAISISSHALTQSVAANQGVSEAGKFLVVGNNGIVTTMSLATWQGGNY